MSKRRRVRLPTPSDLHVEPPARAAASARARRRGRCSCAPRPPRRDPERLLPRRADEVTTARGPSAVGCAPEIPASTSSRRALRSRLPTADQEVDDHQHVRDRVGRPATARARRPQQECYSSTRGRECVDTAPLAVLSWARFFRRRGSTAKLFSAESSFLLSVS